MGYGSKKDFDKMYVQLADIPDKTADNRYGTGWFEKIKDSIRQFLKANQNKPG